MATFHYSKADYLALTSAISGRKLLNAYIIMIPVGLIFLGSWFFMDDAPIRNLVVGTIILIALIFFPLFVRWFLSKTYDQQVALREKITIQIKPDAIYFSQASGTSILPWDRITKWTERGRFILLYESSLPSKAILKSALSSDEEHLLRTSLSREGKV